ncbi:DUF5103 domain-containing protein [Flavobacteriales bacterium]|nr:DUF5103 domain-containing protein [Flavobacteriales bacterium]
MKIKLLFLSSFLFLVCCKIQKENNKFIKEDVVLESNNKNNYNIRTVLLHKKENNLSLPIINLNSAEQLKLSFDDLNYESSVLYITIEHYDAMWNKSNLMKSEYINGFTSDEIINYQFSFNTIQNYIHYEYLFPSDNLKPLLSGNYKFKVYDLNGDTLFNKKFMVLENKINIDLNIKKATLSKDRKIKHELDFTLNHQNINIVDPFSQIKVIIKQNNREDNAITNLKPLYIRNNTLIYDYNEENTFFGNNEFRHFDIKSLRYYSERIKNITYDSTRYKVDLFRESKRAYDNYSIEPDLNGKFYIKSQEARNSNIESEYVYVNFKLKSNFVEDGNIYIIGELSNWEKNNEFKLEFDSTNNMYSKSIYLKQGYYNYHYAINDTALNLLDVARIEGTHYQTRNSYEIYVYFNDTNDRYQKLIGFTNALSKELF